MTEHLYYADSSLTQFEATVTEVQEVSRTEGQSLWRIALDRSAFYPTSGGQPHDTGRIMATSKSGASLTAEIVNVEEDEQGEIWHHTAKPLSTGIQVRGEIDRERRLDHMQQHSGQHLLSAAFLAVCNAPTVSFHLGETVSTIDLAIEDLPAARLRQVEELSNQMIAEDRTVRIGIVSRPQAEAWLASGDLRKLPTRGGDIRIIEIAGDAEEGRPFDRNACGGTHVHSTGQIGGLHLRGIEKVKQGWRVEFVCGLRAMRSVRADFDILTEAGRILSAGFSEIPAAIERLQAENKRAAKQLQAQRNELARYRAAELLRETPVENGLRLIALDFSATDGVDANWLKLLASQLAAQGTKTTAVLTLRSGNDADPATILLTRSADMEFDCGVTLRKVLTTAGGRGGGTNEMAQGSVPACHLEAARQELLAAMQPAAEQK
jgi:alanyl-tRNA synthetase